jgi:acetyltransferase-like isoleucine patch superfamily enzyme
MRSFLRQLLYQFRYVLPIWLAQLLTNWLPENRITIRLRGLLIGPFLGQCGKNLQLARSVTFLNPHGIRLGHDIYIATGCWLDGIGGLTIGDEVQLSPFVVVTTSSHCFKENSSRFGGSRSAPTTIGKGSWLAAHVVVAAGVSIGSGVIVGGNSAVPKNLPDNVFAAGIPAKVIGPRKDKTPNLFARF